MATKVATLVKERPDGTTKLRTRLVVDKRRSLATLLKERIVISFGARTPYRGSWTSCERPAGGS